MKQKEVNTNNMKHACIEHGVQFDEFNMGSFRLTKDGCRTIDYYPKSGKCFYHGSQEWSKVENIAKFIAFEFKGTEADLINALSSNHQRATNAINKAKNIAMVENKGVVTIVCGF